MGTKSSKIMRKDNYGNWFLDFSFDVLFGGEYGIDTQDNDPELEKLKHKPFSFIEGNDDTTLAEILNEICDDEKNMTLPWSKEDRQLYPEISKNITDQAIIIINIAPEDIDQYNKNVP